MRVHSLSSPFAERIDPQMRPQLERFLQFVGPRGFHGIADLAKRRACFEEVMALAAARGPDASRVTRYDVGIARDAGKADLAVRVYRPANIQGVLPGLMYLHGGGMIMGSIAADDGFAAALSEAAGCAVVSVEYGLAPESSGLKPVEDCYDALLWLHGHSKAYDIDPECLGVFGCSAGGGLAAGLSMLARDRGGPALRYQMLIYPMLDDRNTTMSSREIVDLGVWDRQANLEAWELFLGSDFNSDQVSPYVAPGRAQDLSGLPATYIEVGTLDLFFDEDVVFAERLSGHGVEVEFHEYQGAYHGFDQLAPGADATRRAFMNRIDALKRAFHR